MHEFRMPAVVVLVDGGMPDRAEEVLGTAGDTSQFMGAGQGEADEIPGL